MEGSQWRFGTPVAFSTESELPGSEHTYSNLDGKPTEAHNRLLKQDYCMTFFNCSVCVSRTTE